MSPLRRGEIVLEHACRSFAVRTERARTLKDLLMRRRGPAQPAVRALAEVSLHVHPGETVGIVGRNGAGKSSTLRVLAGILPLQAGRMACGGRVVALLELGAGFGGDFSGRENIYLSAALHGLSRAEIEAKLEEIVRFSELGHFIDAPVKTYSSGMLVRLGFAIAAHLDGDVLLIDEVLAVGDEGFQRKCVRLISERIAAGVTLVLVSHDPTAIQRVCARVVVLESGRVVFDGPAVDGLIHYHGLVGIEEDTRPRALRERALAVEDVELRDGAGRPRTFFASGEAMQVSLLIAEAPLVADPELVLEFLDEHARRVFRTESEPLRALADSELGGHRLEGRGLAGGRVTFEIPRLALLGGDYHLAVGAVASDDAEPGFDRLVGFSVAHDPEATGVADLRGTWAVAGERSEVAT